MAEDNNTDLATEVADTNASSEAPVAKKKRTPRQPKTASALATAEIATSPTLSIDAEKPAGRRRGRKPKSADTVAEASASANKAVKATRMKRPAKAVAPAEVPPMTTIDEMEDLIKLEEENKRLRTLLSEKLRNENADLRKRLGHS